MVANVSQRDESLGEQGVHDRKEEVRVGAGPDEQVLVGFFGRLRAAGVDDDELASPGPELPDPPRVVGRGHEAAVRRERVRAQDHEVVGAVDVGDRDAQAGAEHEAGRDLFGHLVDGAGRVQVPAPERLDQHAVVQLTGEVVDVVHQQEIALRAVTRAERVHLLGGDRGDELVGEGLRAHDDDPAPRTRRETPVDLGEGVVPRHLVPRITLAHLRLAQAVGIRIELLQRRALRAQEAVAEHVLAVAAHERDLAPLEAQLEPAGRLAQGTGPVDGSGLTVRRRHACRG